MDPALLLKNAVSTVRTIKTFGVPVVHSTVNVANRPPDEGVADGGRTFTRTCAASWPPATPAAEKPLTEKAP
jgi:hypothetical protein